MKTIRRHDTSEKVANALCYNRTAMASKLGPILKLTGMWLLVPAALAALGYYVIGPRLGVDNQPDKAPAPSTSEPTDDSGSARNYSEPKIEVSVKKGTTISARDIRPPKKKKKPEAKPPEASAPKVEAPVGESTGDPPPTTPPSGDGAGGTGGDG